MNRRDFLKQLGLIATLPLVGLFQASHTFGGWFKPQGENWQFAAMKGDEKAAVKFTNGAMLLDGHIATIWVCAEALPAEQIEALYQQSREFFGI